MTASAGTRFVLVNESDKQEMIKSNSDSLFNLPMVRIVLRTTFSLSLLGLTVCFGFPFNGNAGDLPVGHFGSTNYGDWKATGSAFDSGPAADGLFPRLGIQNARDHQVASSAVEGDGPTGTLTSPEFKIKRKYISF